MLRQNSLSYIDTTRELDVGSWIESLELLDGERCIGLEQYEISGQPGDDPAVVVGTSVDEFDDDEVPLCMSVSA